MSENQAFMESELSAMRAEMDRLRLEVEDGRDLATHPNTASEWYPSQFPSTSGGIIDASGTPGGSAVGSSVPSDTAGYYVKCYSFEAWKSGDTTIVMEPGDVWLGPMSVVHWANFTGESTTPSVSSTDTCVWLEIDVATPAVAMVYGSRAAMESALDSTEQLTKMVWPLVETTWGSGVITKVKNLQCGDVVIPRAAG